MMALLLRMLSCLTGAYTKDPDSNIGRLFRLFAEALWGVEDSLRLIDAWRDVNQAKGLTLDRIGQNFGVARDNATDAFYRLMIKVKVTGLLSGGDVDTVINAASVLFDIDPAQVEAVELIPAKLRVILDEDNIAQEYLDHKDSSARIVKRLMAAGVGKDVVFRRTRQETVPVYMGVTYYVNVTRQIDIEKTKVVAASPVHIGMTGYRNVTLHIEPMEG